MGGVNSNALWVSNLPVGNIPTSQGDLTEEAIYLVPVATPDRELGIQFYNVEMADQQLVLVNDSETGYAPITVANPWGDIQKIFFGANQLAQVEIQSTYSDLTRGVRLDGL